MEKYKKYYQKAMDYYCQGDLDNALKFCEKSLAENNNNSAVLNLKGLLYYLLGNLNEARMIWKISMKLYNDGISRKYLEDSDKDKENLDNFYRGVSLYNNMKINDAIEYFTCCGESDFNSIKVNFYLAQCYEKLGKYNEAEYYISKVLKIQKTNKDALKMQKQLKSLGADDYSFGTEHKGKVLKVFVALFIAIVIIIAGVFGGKKIITIKRQSPKVENNVQEENKPVVEQLQNTENKEENEASESNVSKSQTNESALDYNLINKYIEGKNYDELAAFINEAEKHMNDSNIGMNEKALINKGKSVLERAGTESFYNVALKLMENKKYDEAQKKLILAEQYGSNNYLYQHILFIAAVCYEAQGDVANADKYYETYISKFEKGSYIEEALYKVAILNKGIDNVKAKKYAEILRSTYANSKFNNSKVEEILNIK